MVSASGRSLACSLIAGSRTHCHCSLFLHRLHSLTASLRRLTNRSLLLSSLSPLSSLCLLHASNKLVASERGSGRPVGGSLLMPRARGIPEGRSSLLSVRVPPAQFGHRAPLHPSIPLAAVRPSVRRRCPHCTGTALHRWGPTAAWSGAWRWFGKWSPGVRSSASAQAKLLLALARSISNSLRIRCHC